MRQLLFLVSLAMASTMCPTGARAQVPDSDRVVMIVRRLEDELSAAVIKQDRARMTEILSPQFSLVSSADPRRPLSGEAGLDLLSPFRTRAVAVRDLNVRVFARRPPWHRWPDLAVASYFADVKATGPGPDRAATLFVTDIWRLDGSRWRVVARYAYPPAPVAGPHPTPPR